MILLPLLSSSKRNRFYKHLHQLASSFSFLNTGVSMTGLRFKLTKQSSMPDVFRETNEVFMKQEQGWKWKAWCWKGDIMFNDWITPNKTQFSFVTTPLGIKWESHVSFKTVKNIRSTTCIPVMLLMCLENRISFLAKVNFCWMMK